MTPTPPSSTGHSPQDATQAPTNAYRVVRKRNRVPLSCGPCRNRKLKCNRSQPCENCVRRGDSSSCTYATTAHSSARSRKQSGGSTGSSSDEMQSRIDRLEGLVLSLMSGNGNNISPGRDRSSSTEAGSGPKPYSFQEDDDEDAMQSIQEDDDDHRNRDGDAVEDQVEEVRNALGIMKVHQGKSFYRGETHWAAILSEITEVKKFFDETKQKYENELAQMKITSMSSKLDSTGFPFSAGPPPTRQEILNLVPRQELVDILVDAYFRNYDPIFHVLHRPTFYKQYEQFWRDRTKVDTIWLGLLMMIMSIALKIIYMSGEEPAELRGKCLEMSHGFRTGAEQCLVVGEFMKKSYIHTVQTLILLCTATNNRDNFDATWLFMGTVVRIAMGMGLHRDPGQFQAITPGDREIRRRLWTVISCMDLLTSIQIGLPSMVKQEECDTGLPLNLHDDEIGEGVTVMPPERGKNELTGVSYMIAKACMAGVYWEIVRQVNSVGPRPNYDIVLKLDQQIRDRYDSIPAFLKLQSKEESKNDPAWLVIQRYNLDLLAQKAYVSLHRPYARLARANTRFLFSSRKCVDAAMTLLSHQAEIRCQTQTNLRHARWFTESIGGNDFLHAAMIVCLHLSRTAQDAPSTNEALSSFSRLRQYEALERTQEIYRRQQECNIEAAKCYGVLSVMMEKLVREDPAFAELRQQQRPPVSLGDGPDFYESGRQPALCPANSTGVELNDPLKTDQAATMTLGMMSGGGLTPNTASILLDRTQSTTPGGSLPMADISNTNSTLDPALAGGGNGPMSAPSPGMILGGALSPPSNWSGPGFWGQNTMDMPNGLEWDEWDDFMQGVNLDTSQMAGWPVMAGLTSGPTVITHSPADRETAITKKDSGGGSENGAEKK